MSAANWRNAMNSGAGRAVMMNRGQAAVALPLPGVGGNRGLSLISAIRTRHVVVLAFLLAYPWFATPFFTFQIGAQSLALGLIALSLTFLGGYGGMISLAQMTVAGIAGYMVGIFGTSGAAEISLGWPWWVVVTLALAIATLARDVHRPAPVRRAHAGRPRMPRGRKASTRTRMTKVNTTL